MPPRASLLDAPYLTRRSCYYHVARRRFVTTQGSSLPELSQISKYPPEHPKFIEIPRPVQPQYIPTRRIKGNLPVPRNLFPPNRTNKATPEYLASVTPEPLPHNITKSADEQTNDFITYKHRRAGQRRQNLREGVVELASRKERMDRSMGYRSQRKQAFNRRAQTAPEREDERLTKATVVQADLPRRKMIIPDPHREQNLALKRGNVAAYQRAQEEEQRVMLHTLYVNAANFITTGEQLDKAIEEAFDRKHFRTSANEGANIWNLGEPETTAQLLGNRGSAAGKTSNAVDEKGEIPGLIDERMRRLGEELTGGKA